MLRRLLSTSLVILASSQVLSAADPVIPPAPTQSGIGNIPVPPPVPPQPAIQFTPPPLPLPSTSSPPLAPAQSQPPSALPSVTPVPQQSPQPAAASQIQPIPERAIPTYSNSIPSGQQYQGPSQGYIQPGIPPQTEIPFNSTPSYAPGEYPANYDGGNFGLTNHGPYGVQYNSFANGPSYPDRYYTGPAASEHARYPYYSYRRPWYSPGPVSRNVNIIW